MFTKWSHTAIALVIALFLSENTLAQNLSAEKSKLANYEKQVALLNSQQQALQENIDRNEKELSSMASQESPEKDKLNAAKKNLDQHQTAYDADPSSQNKSRLSNAEFKYALAERKYKKANSAQSDLINKISEDRNQLSSNSDKILGLQQSIGQQGQVIEQVKSDQLAKEKAMREQQQRQLAEDQRLANEKANQEIARLKALLEAEALEAKVAASKPPVIESQSPTAQSMSASPSEQTVAAVEQVVAAAETPLEKNYTLLTNQDEVKAEEDRLAALAQQPKGRQKTYNKILNVKTSNGNSMISAITLKPLGHEQYRGKGKLSAGSFVFSIGFHHWDVSIETAGSYQIILNSADSKNPKLVYFNDLYRVN
jgi:hypothetical protein